MPLLTPLATRSRARPPTAPTTALELTMCCTDPDRSLRHAVAVAAGEASPEDPDPADGMTVQAFLDACEARAHRPDRVLLIRGHLRSESRAFHVADFGIAFSDGVLPARFLERHLGVKVLTLNSFGQVSQVIREMLEVGQLDTAQAHRYFNVGSRKGGRYGHRFNRLMRSVYTAIGSPSGTVTPATLDLMRGRLHREIGRTVLPCLGRELRPFADREVRRARGSSRTDSV